MGILLPQAIAALVRSEDQTDFPTVYESGLEEAIEELREQTERECAQYKEELEYRYKEKVRKGYPFGGKRGPNTVIRTVHNNFKEMAHFMYGDTFFCVVMCNFSCSYVYSWHCLF